MRAHTALPAGPPPPSSTPEAIAPGDATADGRPLDAARRVSLAALLQRPDLWRGHGLAAGDAATIASGFPQLDAELPGGGWPAAACVELLPGTALAASGERYAPAASVRRAGGACDGGMHGAGNGALSLLVPALARLTAAGRWVALVAPPLAPHAPAWLRAGVDLAHLLHVDAADAGEACWAAERCLRAGAVAAVVAWPGLLPFATRKRLQLAAEAGRTTLFALLPALAAGQPSPAPLRLAVAARSDGVAVRILKRRGPFCERTLAVPLARPLRQRTWPASPPEHDAARRHAPAAVATAAGMRTGAASFPTGTSPALAPATVTDAAASRAAPAASAPHPPAPDDALACPVAARPAAGRPPRPAAA